MVKLKGPSLATAAAGGLGEILTFSQSKGRSYVKKWSKPKNPKSATQQSMRATMAFLSEEWRGLSAAEQALWEPLAADANVPPFNAYLTFNLTNARNGLAPSKMPDPPRTGAYGGTTARTATAVSRGVLFEITVGAPGDGWGSHIYNLPSAGHPKSWDHLIHIINRETTGVASWTWRPITPDTYYFAIAPANRFGRLWTGQHDRTVVVS